jgi:hypothetical protein
MSDLAGSTNKSKVIWLKRMSLSLNRSRDMVVCQKTKKWNCGGIHRITWRGLWVFKFFIRYHGEFTFSSCSIDVPVLSYGQIFSGVRCVREPAISSLPPISSTTVFNRAESRRLDKLAEEMAVLLTDNCPSHIAWAVM